jgi:hypothetical protein
MQDPRQAPLANGGDRRSFREGIHTERASGRYDDGVMMDGETEMSVDDFDTMMDQG